MPDEEVDLTAGIVHELHRAYGVGDLVGERPVAPVPFGVAKAQVVEAQHADALAGELLADPARCRAVLAEREAMGEDAPTAHLAFRHIHQARQDGAGGARKADAFGHAWLADQLGVELGHHAANAVLPVDRGAADEFAHQSRVGRVAPQRLRALLEDRFLADQ